MVLPIDTSRQGAQHWRSVSIRARTPSLLIECAELGGEEVLFDCVVCEQQGFLVGEAGLVGAVEPAQVFRAGGGQVVVAGQLRLGSEGVRRWSSGRC